MGQLRSSAALTTGAQVLGLKVFGWFLSKGTTMKRHYKMFWGCVIPAQMPYIEKVARRRRHHPHRRFPGVHRRGADDNPRPCGHPRETGHSHRGPAAARGRPWQLRLPHGRRVHPVQRRRGQGLRHRHRRPCRCGVPGLHEMLHRKLSLGYNIPEGRTLPQGGSARRSRAPGQSPARMEPRTQGDSRRPRRKQHRVPVRFEGAPWRGGTGRPHPRNPRRKAGGRGLLTVVRDFAGNLRHCGICRFLRKNC